MHRRLLNASLAMLSSALAMGAGECAAGTSGRHNALAPEALLPLTRPTAPRHALLISRAGDCDSRLGFAVVFQRSLRGIRFEGIVVVDGSDDATLTRPDNLPEMPRPSSFPAFSVFAETTRLPLPLLLIYGPDRRLQMAIHAPVTASGAESLVDWLASQ